MKREVLVLDGDTEARAGTVRVLTERGYGVRDTSSADEAASILTRHAAGVAVIDVLLDDMGGLEAIEMLRSVRPELRVIVTAAENTRELEAAVRQKDIVYYHVKDFGRDELVEAVAEAFGDRQMREKTKILIVDDDRDYQAAVRNILENAGYEVVQAYTKEEGLNAVKRADPNLVILDIMMTRSTDGFHFLYEIGAGGRAKRPPVLSVSCISEKTGMDFCPTGDEDYFPADDFLSKPVAPPELLAHIENLLAGTPPAAAP